MSHNLELVIESERKREALCFLDQEYTYDEAMRLCIAGYKVTAASDKLSKVYLFSDGKDVYIERGYDQEPTPYLFYSEHKETPWVIVQTH